MVTQHMASGVPIAAVGRGWECEREPRGHDLTLVSLAHLAVVPRAFGPVAGLRVSSCGARVSGSSLEFRVHWPFIWVQGSGCVRSSLGFKGWD